MKKLSIIVLFCDKDYQYLDSFIDGVLTRVACCNEVIFVDNRALKKEKLRKLRSLLRHSSNYKYVDMNENARQLIGRKAGLSQATGDYVWFVDVDDMPKNISQDTLESCKSDVDMFSLLEHSFEDEDVDVSIRFDCKAYQRKYAFGLWTKFFKREFIIKIFEKIPKVYGSLCEDALISYMAYYFLDSMSTHSQEIYEPHLDRSLSSYSKKLSTKEELEYVITGFNEILGIFNYCIKNTAIYNSFCYVMYFNLFIDLLKTDCVVLSAEKDKILETSLDKNAAIEALNEISYYRRLYANPVAEFIFQKLLEA